MISKKDIQEISKEIDMPAEQLKRILKEVSKPSLDNIDCPHFEIGVGSSDKD